MPRQKRKKKVTQHAIECAVKRQEQKDAGVFDGRYRVRVERSKKQYTRRSKHQLDPSD